MDDKLPTINLELSSGVFKIRTQDAVYQISVTPDSSLTRVVEKVVEKEVARESAPVAAPPAAAVQVDIDDPFYREITEELYAEIGKLARQLSLSIKEIPGDHFEGVNIEQTGVELEDAKGQLEDIVQMTEKATMDIMDLAESIQEDLQGVQSQLDSITTLDFMVPTGDDDLDWGDVGDESISGDEPMDAPVDAGGPGFLSSMLEKQSMLLEFVNNLPKADDAPAEAEPAPAPPPPEPEVKKVTEYNFEIDVVFQTIYELCTNETVKDHIKIMRQEQDTAFDTEVVRKELSDMASTVEVEDNFYNFSITAVLKSLFQASKNDKHKQILKKMNQTAANIFLDGILPLEGTVEEKEITVQPEAPAPTPAPQQAPPAAAKPGLPPDSLDELVSLINENISLLETEKQKLEDAESTPPDKIDLGPDFTSVKTEDRSQIISSIETSNEGVNRITSHINRILEALSFQDLSGQRILKIVRLISEVQVQLLSLLVAFGSKIRQREAELEATPDETAKMAQDEVDKMLELVSTPSTLEGPAAEGRLDQGAVNDLLADLGF